ncbi:MAG: hypothetical protein JWP91_4601 [Fibrobacteres bacterium]|nr:hypothetical protein [Fibrobacterota bacterium]
MMDGDLEGKGRIGGGRRMGRTRCTGDKAWMVLAGLVGGIALGPVQAALGMDAVHPAFELAAVPLPAKYRAMGMAFLPDGRMVLLTAGKIGGGEIPEPDPESAVYLISDIASASPSAVKIASMFRQPSGVNVVDDKIFVSDRDAFYSIPSNGNVSDPAANRVKIAAWPMGGNWHHWVFTPMYRNGYFYAPYSGSIKQGGWSDVPATSEYAGALIKFDPAGKTFERFAGGLRSPNGANMNDAGEMFVMDNQGSWVPGCAFMHMKADRFYGHRQSPPQAPNWAEKLPYQPPAVWIPYPSASAAGSATSQPVYIDKGAYAGQWLAGDANGPGLTRYALELVKGDYQGTVFRFTNGMQNAAINRMVRAPDGTYYLGSLEHFGNWPGSGLMPLYKLIPKPGASAFEMYTIQSLKDGFEIVFTEPVDRASVSTAAISVKQWHYTRQNTYFGGKDADEPRTVARTDVSSDGKRVYVQIPGLKAMDYVVAFKLAGIKSAAGGKAPWDNEAWYTLNAVSDRAWDPIGLAARQARSNSLDVRLQVSAAGPGRIKVAVSMPGAWSLALRSMDGRLVARLDGYGSGTHLLSAGTDACGLYLLEARTGAETFTRKAMF